MSNVAYPLHDRASDHPYDIEAGKEQKNQK